MYLAVFPSFIALGKIFHKHLPFFCFRNWPLIFWFLFLSMELPVICTSSCQINSLTIKDFKVLVAIPSLFCFEIISKKFFLIWSWANISYFAPFSSITKTEYPLPIFLISTWNNPNAWSYIFLEVINSIRLSWPNKFSRFCFRFLLENLPPMTLII